MGLNRYLLYKNIATLVFLSTIFIALTTIIVHNIHRFHNRNKGHYFLLKMRATTPSAYELALEAPNKAVTKKAPLIFLSQILTGKELIVCQSDTGLFDRQVAGAWLLLKKITTADNCEISSATAKQYEERASQSVEFVDRKISIILDQQSPRYQLFSHAGEWFLVPRSQ